MILAGDTLAQTMLGHQDTLAATVDGMVRASAAVACGAWIVADMPFVRYQARVEDPPRNAGRPLKEGSAQAVKIEGGAPVIDTVRASDASQLVDDALALEDAGAFSIVLELISVELAEVVPRRLSIPTIGIGSGISCDGEG